MSALANKIVHVFFSYCWVYALSPCQNCIVGISSLLKDDEGLNEEQQESLQMIHSSSNLLRSIIDDVLGYSKLQHGGQLEIGPTNLHEVLHGIVRSLSSSQLALSKSIKIQQWCDPTLGPCIETDKRRLSQILLNLLSNGVKFSNDKGVVDLEVRPAGTSDQPVIRFVVTDHGKGIEKDHFESIFEPFHQTKLGIESVGGTGKFECHCSIMKRTPILPIAMRYLFLLNRIGPKYHEEVGRSLRRDYFRR